MRRPLLVVLLGICSFACGETITDDLRPVWLTFERFDDPTTVFRLTIYGDRECFVSVTRIGEPLGDGFCAVEHGPRRNGMIAETSFAALDALFADEKLDAYRRDSVTAEGSGCAVLTKYHLGTSDGPARNLHSPWFTDSGSENSAETTAMLNELNDLLRTCHMDGEPWSEVDAEKERTGGWPTP